VTAPYCLRRDAAHIDDSLDGLLRREPEYIKLKPPSIDTGNRTQPEKAFGVAIDTVGRLNGRRVAQEPTFACPTLGWYHEV